MELKQMIVRIADEADDFLEGVTSRDQARAAISEMITLHFRDLSGDDRAYVIAGVMRLLEDEGFFDDLRRGSDDADSDSELE